MAVWAGAHGRAAGRRCVVSSYPDTIVVYATPSFDTMMDPDRRGEPVWLRVCVEHREPEVKICGWSVVFQAAPNSLVSWPELEREVVEHAKRCPFAPGGAS